MSVDIFGRGSSELSQNVKSIRGPPGVGFKLTSEDQFDIEKKRLCNVGEPLNKEDAVNLKRLQKAIKSVRNEIEEQKIRINALSESFEKHDTFQKFDNQEESQLHARHAENILQLDKRLLALEKIVNNG